MFKCADCFKFIGPRVASITVPTGTRKVDYTNTYNVEDDYGNQKPVTVQSVGTEITGEKKVCPECAKLSESLLLL